MKISNRKPKDLILHRVPVSINLCFHRATFEVDKHQAKKLKFSQWREKTKQTNKQIENQQQHQQKKSRTHKGHSPVTLEQSKPD